MTQGQEGNGTPTGQTDWTIMVYFAADSALANFAVESLKQINKSLIDPLMIKSKAAGAAQADVVVAEAGVVVAAQFSIDAPGGQKIRRFIFDKSSPETLKKPNEKDPLDKRNDLLFTEKQALEDFLGWAFKEAKAKHYALILWSHGPELFLQPPLGGTSGDSASLYLAPEDLRDALAQFNKLRSKECDLEGERKLEIVGFDACSMSMFEVAYEIKDLAQLMMASQEEVPDASFPYYDLVQLFRRDGNVLGPFLDATGPKGCIKDRQSSQNATISAVAAHAGLKAGVTDYLSAYQDYIVGTPTGMNPVTLSVLNLAQCDGLKGAVCSLANALLNLKNDSELLRRLIHARKNSQDYAGGLYVDLHEFCTNLSKQLNANETDKWNPIKTACAGVLQQFEPSETPFILINGAVTETGDPLINAAPDATHNHGISIYLPYLTDRQFDDAVNRPMVKGGRGTNGGKSIPNSLNMATGDYLMSTLQTLILTTESYYGDLRLAADTAWYDFITEQWTKAIKETDPAPNFRYSSRQIEINTGRPISAAKPCKQAPELSPYEQATASAMK